jgi:hypothetical protein
MLNVAIKAANIKKIARIDFIMKSDIPSASLALNFSRLKNQISKHGLSAPGFSWSKN